MKDLIPRCYRPGPPLDSYVECLWHFPVYSVPHERERALPTGTTETVFNRGSEPMRIFRDEHDLVGQRFGRAVVCGPHSRYFILDTSNSGRIQRLQAAIARITRGDDVDWASEHEICFSCNGSVLRNGNCFRPVEQQ